MLMSASSGIKIETPWISLQWDLILLPHPGCCSLPTAPVVAACWILPLAADPAVVLVYIYACMLVIRERRQVQRMTSLDDVTHPSSPSGANKLACAYCQASPAALAVAPSSGAPLSSLNHPIWSNIHGDMNFPSRHALFFHAFRYFAKIRNSYGDQNVREII